jgi:hypothetical protein
MEAVIGEGGCILTLYFYIFLWCFVVFVDVQDLDRVGTLLL